ncbi:UNVERIFIED_CONTAM: hypothetical protein HDU68_003446 [Siphonaria sp. JEL0065]|nr:hypothetical protein HDU68_003446 [Siphonaria sp. JEL0065]
MTLVLEFDHSDSSDNESFYSLAPTTVSEFDRESISQARFEAALVAPRFYDDNASVLSIDDLVISHHEEMRPVLIQPLATGVSMLAQTARISLAATGAVSGAVLSTARWSTALTLSIGRSIITETSIKAVTDAFSLAELFTYGTWHLADSSVRLSLTAATETIQILDGVFGSTETSRAISSIVALIQDEIRSSIHNGSSSSAEATILGTLGSIATLGSVSKALTAFACLQAATYQRSLKERRRVETVFDGVVDKGGEEGEVSVRWHHEKLSFDGAMTTMEVNDVGVRQRTSLQNLRRPVLISLPEEDEGIITLEDAKVLVQETHLQGRNVKLLESVDSFRVAASEQSEFLPEGLISISADGKVGGNKAFLDGVSKDFAGKDMDGLLSDFEHNSLGGSSSSSVDGLSGDRVEERSKGKAWSFFKALYGSKSPVETIQPAKSSDKGKDKESTTTNSLSKKKTIRKRQSVVTMFDETRSTQQSSDGSSIERFGFRLNNHQLQKLENTPFSSLFYSYGNNYKQYPLPHLLSNFERYCRFSSAAYGAEFMKLMGVGNLRDIHTTDESIHANHYAFAIHAGIPVNDIILSSYTDSMIQAGATQNKPLMDPVFHYVALDRVARVVVVSLRGTLALNDVLTDLKADYADFMGYKVHSGMLRSAALMYRKGAAVRDAVKRALDENPTYGLILTGHSLGGGVAALLALRWACKTSELGIRPTSPYYPPTPFVTSGRGGFPRGRPIHCYAYGSPCAVSLDFSISAKGLVSTLVNGDDIVPTLSIGLVRDMKAVTMSLLDPKNRGLSEKIIWKTLGFQGSSGSSSSSTADNDFLWNVSTQLRGAMQNERLFVAGNAYWMVSSETVTLDGALNKKKSTCRVTLERIDDVREMNQEPRFSSRLLSDHFPTNYEQTLGALVEAVFGSK